MFGLSLIVVPTIVYGGLTVLGVVTNRLMGSPGPANLSQTADRVLPSRPRPCRSSYFACNAPANRGRLRCDPQFARLVSPSGSNRRSYPGFRGVLCRGPPAVVALCSLHRRGSGRGDDPDCGSRVDPFAMRIDSIQRHAPAHTLS
jgi:hypothetical protein